MNPKLASRIASWLLAAAILVQLPIVAAAGFRNAATLELTRARLEPNERAAGRVRSAGSLLQWADTLGSPSLATRWASARAALASGDSDRAAALLLRESHGIRHNPVLAMALLEIAPATRSEDEALRLFEADLGAGAPRRVRDAAAALYLRKARSVDGASARRMYGRVLDLRPGDLSANLAMFKRATAGGDREAAARRSLALRQYPLAALDARTEALGDEVGRAVFELITSGTWDEAEGARAVGFLVWRYAKAHWVRQLAAQLAGAAPSGSTWRLLLAESYARSAMWREAVAEYERVIAADSECPVARLHLAFALEKLAGEQREPALRRRALDAFETYLTSVPEDFLALKAAVALRRELGETPNPAGAARLTESLDDVAIVRSALRLSEQAEVAIGPDLSASQGFGTWDRDAPSRWRWLDQAFGGELNRGLFLGGRDDHAGWDGAAVRLTGLWLATDPAARPGAFGIRPPGALLEPTGMYLISFLYRTRGLPADAVNLYTSPTLGGRDFLLPATRGAWRRVVAVAPRKVDEGARSVPILRLFSAGDVWWDDFKLAEIHLPADTKVGAPVIRVLP